MKILKFLLIIFHLMLIWSSSFAKKTASIKAYGLQVSLDVGSTSFGDYLYFTTYDGKTINNVDGKIYEFTFDKTDFNIIKSLRSHGWSRGTSFENKIFLLAITKVTGKPTENRIIRNNKLFPFFVFSE